MAEKVILKHDLDIHGTYYRAIGEVIARWALFEYHLMDAMAKLVPVNDPKKKRVLFMTMGVNPKLGILKSLVDNWLPNGPLKSEMHQIIKGAQVLKDLRHKFAHGVWGHKEGKKQLHLLYVDEAKEVYLPNSTIIPAKEIRNIALAIRILDKRLLTATRGLGA
jgi:hypothetical protein